MSNIREFLNREDPLTRGIAEFLLKHDEEDDLVDYKESFDPDAEKDWLEITKDISAFANTLGGYLVFGVSDIDKEIIGISRKFAVTLKDVNNIQQKINRNLEPDISLLRSKEYRFSGKSIIVLFIPRSIGRTHLISKDGTFNYPSGADKTILRKGTLYIRRSASNHLVDSRDLDDLLERRIDQFRDSLMNKVARVVESPINSDVYILSKDPTSEESQRFIIENSPDSIPIKGMSFTVAPQGVEEEIAAFSVLKQGSSEVRPPISYLWRWYSDREKIQISNEHKLSIFQFSLWEGIPSFYWIKDLKSQVIREKLIETIRQRPAGLHLNDMLIVAAYLGKGTYNQALSTLGDYRNRINPRMNQFPERGPIAEFQTIDILPNVSINEFKEAKLIRLNFIVEEAAEPGNVAGLYDQWESVNIDRFLYADENQYK